MEITIISCDRYYNLHRGTQIWEESFSNLRFVCLPLSADFVIELVKRLDVRYDGIRIGAVIYSNFAENKIFMNTEFDKNLLLQVSATQ